MELRSGVDRSLLPTIIHRLDALSDGVAEFCTSNLFLFRDVYSFSIVWNRPLEVYGITNGKKFVSFPEDIPSVSRLQEIRSKTDYIRAIPERLHTHPHFKELGLSCTEDPNDFEYLYSREALATLSGRKYHKKRNLISQFQRLYSYELAPINHDTCCDALEILTSWHKNQTDDADYIPARNALMHYEELGLEGWILYINDGNPIAYTLGERIPNTTTWALHYEKALITYKGAFQMIDKQTAAMLPEEITHINKEQDLGDPGLRHAKMSYHPESFLKKFICEW